VNRGQQPGRFADAAGACRPLTARPRAVAPAPPLSEDDRLAAELVLRALAQQLIAIEEWCGRHSEYFLG